MRIGLMAASTAAVLGAVTLGGAATAGAGHGWGSHAGGGVYAHPVMRSGHWGGRSGPMRTAGVGQNWSSQGGHRLQWQPMAREGRHWGDDHDSFAQDHMRRFAGRDFDRDDRFRREGRSWDDQGFGFGVGLGVDAGAGLYADGGYDEGSYGGYPAVENDDDQYAPDVTTDEGYGYGGEAYGDDEGRGGGYYDAGNYDAGADASREDRGFGERGRGSWDDERGARSTYDVRACSCGTWRWIPDQGR